MTARMVQYLVRLLLGVIMAKLAPRNSCVMSYLFIAHAYNNKDLDDAATVDEVKRKFGLDTDYIIDHRDDEFHVPEARDWKRYTQMEKCNEVMKAQEEWLSSNR